MRRLGSSMAKEGEEEKWVGKERDRERLRTQ